MLEALIIRLCVIAVGIAIVPVWTWLGVHNRRVGWFAAIPIVLALMPVALNLYILLTPIDCDCPNAALINLVSSIIRLITLNTILIGGLVMAREWRQRDRAIRARLAAANEDRTNDGDRHADQ